MARQSFISNLGGYALKKLGLIVNGIRTEYDTTEPKEVTINSAPKFWYWDAMGNNNSDWVTIDSDHMEGRVALNFTDINHTHIKTNFTANDPEAFPHPANSAWIILKKGLWRYTLLLELECTEAGTGQSDMILWVRGMREGLINYVLIRPTHAPINNGVTKTYTRLLTGLFYSDADPVKSGNDYLVERNLRFDVECVTDAVYRFRQSSLMLEQLKI